MLVVDFLLLLMEKRWINVVIVGCCCIQSALLLLFKVNYHGHDQDKNHHYQEDNQDVFTFTALFLRNRDWQWNDLRKMAMRFIICYYTWTTVINGGIRW